MAADESETIMHHKAPGKAHREGISIMELCEMFPDEDSAREWFEAQIWPEGRCCPKCGSIRTHEAKHAKSPYRCTDCRAYFSVKSGTAFEGSKVPLRKWVFAFYLETTSLKGVSSMKLHRDIGVTQKTAWFMLHRIREVWAKDKAAGFAGPVEVDETYFGGKRKNMSNEKRRELADAGIGRGLAGKVAVVGIKDRETKQVRAKVVEHTDKATLQGFVVEHTASGATVYTDEAAAYEGLPFKHETVKHSVSEYVRGMAHTNGAESFWSMLKRAHMGTYHKLSPKHLDRYVKEFAGRQNMREQDTIDQMASVATGAVGKRLTYDKLIADNGLSSGARSA